MKRMVQTILVVAIILHLPAASCANEFKVVRVYDGDTLKAVRNNTEIEVRLVGIDAPENSRKEGQIGQPYCKKATMYLGALVLNKTVDIEIYGQNRLGQTLGVVYTGGKNINLEMLKGGFAEVYRGKTAEDLDLQPYWEAEKEAKKALRGIWELRDQYFSPKDWRIMHGYD
jgi:endonuclease YncB( thermonuclease family)